MINDASLVMIPSGYKDGTLYSVKPTNGDGDFTFSRGSNLAATRVNSEGLIEKGRENLLLQSNTFDTTWSLSNGTLTGGQTGYDGSSDAWEFDASGTAQVSQSVSTSGVHTYSVYAKAGTENGLFLRANGGLNPRCFFNLDSGTIGSEAGGLIDSKMVDVGNGWYRCSIVYSDTTNEARIYVANNSGGFPTSGSIYIQDAQLEQGLVATEYIETTTTTAQAGILEDMPRLDYSGGATCPSLLLEPQRTNLLYYSSAAPLTTTTSASNEWVIYSGSTAVVNDAIGIDGYQNATKYINAYNATSDYMLYRFLTVTSGNTYTVSGYLKLGTATNACIVLNDGTAWDTISGGNFVATASEGYDEWKRFEITFTAPSNNKLNIHIGYHNETGVAAQSLGNFYLDSFQVEEGSYPTSYIPTYGASVTRGADSCSKTGISSLIGQTEGVIYMNVGIVHNNSVTGAGKWFFEVRKDATNSFGIGSGGADSAPSIRFVTQISGSYSTDAEPTNFSNSKIAIKYNSSNFKIFQNGVLKNTIAKSIGDYADIEFMEGAGNDLSMPVKQFSAFPTALSDDECIQLTTL
jgi:hypothetical protein